MKTFFLLLGLLLLIVLEVLRVYFIMPFPGSQQGNTIGVAYWLDQNIAWLRLLLWAIVAYLAWRYLPRSSTRSKAMFTLVFLLYAFVFYLFNFRFLADKMFHQPRVAVFSSGPDNQIEKNKLVLGVAINNESKAYPIQLIGYHHQVRDSVGGMPVMVTYCTVCRTGRVFSPIVDGRNEKFRLVGMDHFNAMFEDATTKSWWRQASGEAIEGPLKGKRLQTLPSQQMTLASWLKLHPASTILQPDTLFAKEYKELADYDRGVVKSKLEKRDSLSWKLKSWVIGVAQGREAKAFDWNELVAKKIVQDSLKGLPILIVLDNDTASFHVWNRNVDGTVLRFDRDHGDQLLRDENTASHWNAAGICVDGPMKGARLVPVDASQEFWHSWKTFHPYTTRAE